jgi:hypothetical protein
MSDELKKEIEDLINEKLREIFFQMYKSFYKEVDFSKLPPDGL